MSNPLATLAPIQDMDWEYSSSWNIAPPFYQQFLKYWRSQDDVGVGLYPFCMRIIPSDVDEAEVGSWVAKLYFPSLTGHLIVTHSYNETFDRIMARKSEQPSRPVLITGQPGIGTFSPS